ncbi:uncharacterized protein F4807DRAFT_457896 [Annulohypoxylon truncatum]|uniref:uncharacterized protein n=1 Tax=Annulohypoxylon truncatum TaxID=327061 RepID=UPI002007A459|nr:uncharacterized protein F4807DRAFT_457896 [Annulohypoxylon truncatum]KAI1212400.1 hypothetical protein F4807DRAFT_457896 [Annulohypoxylon truncatum]
MTLNPILPQPAWVDPLPSDHIFASESHFRSNPEIGVFVFCCQGFSNCPLQLSEFWAGDVSQQRSRRTMDDQHWFQHMAADSGDEAFATEDLYNDCFPVTDASAPYGRSQTNAVGVSAVNVGRDFGPSPAQQNKPAGNEQMFLPNLRLANGYARGFGANYDARQYPWQAYNNTGANQTTNYLDYPDGLPDNQWQHNMPVFGEPLEGPQVSPSSFSSSIPSSATSDAMAAMTLDSMAAHSNAIGTPRANNSVSGSEASGNTWASGYPPTISPKMLRLNPSPTHTSSSESIHTNMLASCDPDVGTSTGNPPFGHQLRSPFNPNRQVHKPRKELPSKPMKPRSLPTAPFASKSRDKKQAPPQLPSGQLELPQKPKVSQEIQEPQSSTTYEFEASPVPSSQGNGDMRLIEETRSAKDEFLVRAKREGLTYREIRKKGNFTEAESTLRGRFRTLTKDKEARVRKPEWRDNDIRLLKKAVRKLCRGEDSMPTKAPWGQISEYIVKNGGSYQFGSATCHRKWKELVEEGKTGMKKSKGQVCTYNDGTST